MKFRHIGLHISLAIMSLMILFGGTVMNVKAEENPETSANIEAETQKNLQGKLMVTAVQTEGKEKPDQNAAVVAQLSEGTNLLAVGEEENGWYEIYYQGKNIYVSAEDLTASKVMDTTILDQEMQKIAEEDRAYIESLEMQRAAISRSRVWRVVIIVLIAAVFLVGIVSALRKTKVASGEKNAK